MLRYRIEEGCFQVGRIIGKGGGNVREMQRLTGAVIKLPEQVFNFYFFSHPKLPGNVIINPRKLVIYSFVSTSTITPGHVNWRGDKCAHHWTFLLDPVCPAPHPRDGCRTPRRRRSPHPGPPPPQRRRGQHLTHTTSLLCRRAADTLVDVEELHLETS